MSDCLKCFFPREEPKGNRTCGKCGRSEAEKKGHYVPLDFRTLADTVTDLGAQSLDAQSVPLPTDRAVANSPPYACLDEPLPPPLPAHSKMGGSAAHRFLNCPGSTALISQLQLDEGDDPDYRRDGVQAHEWGAKCLETDKDAWELFHEYPDLGPSAGLAVQDYINYVRSLPGRRRVEVKIHLPDLHPQMFSTIDVTLTGVLGKIALRVIDYKHGEGVYVEVENNEQLMYYGGMVIMENPAEFDDADLVELTIVQPRIAWAEPIRSWVTTVGALKQWLYDVLLPAMNLAAKDMHLQLGEWCRFCPAKLVCPAMTQAMAAFSGGATADLTTLPADTLGRDYALIPMVKMRLKAIENEVYRRRMAGEDVPNSKIVRMITDRVWKPEAEDALRTRFGNMAYTSPKLLSPAMMEKLPEGKLVVAEWAYKPEGGYTVALVDDKRKEVALPSPEEKYGDPTKYVVDVQGGV